MKVGLVDGELVANPTPSQAALSDLSLTYAGASGARALMVEAAGDEVGGTEGGQPSAPMRHWHARAVHARFDTTPLLPSNRRQAKRAASMQESGQPPAARP